MVLLALALVAVSTFDGSRVKATYLDETTTAGNTEEEEPIVITNVIIICS